jgi:hypothetical protein
MAKKTPSLAVGRGEKLSVAKGAGLTAKGRAKYNAATGSNLKAPQPEGGPRKKSFCARMSGMPGPMKDEKGRPTRNVEMEDSVQTARELATHANEIKHIQSDMDQVLQELEAMKTTIDSINQKLDRAEGGWKTLIWIGGLATSVTGVIGYIVGQIRG